MILDWSWHRRRTDRSCILDSVMALSQEAFNKLTKAEAHAVYMELHQRYKDSEATNKQLLNQQEVLHSILDQQKAIFKCVVDKPDVVVPSTAANCNDAPALNLKVRSFQTRQIANTATNLILGSSTVARGNQNELPLDMEIIPYSGSTTDEKMTILQKTNFAQLKTIIIQDGTNSMLSSKQIYSEIRKLKAIMRENSNCRTYYQSH